MITAIEFCSRYVEWLEMIDQTIRAEYYPAIREMYKFDPHDLISPVACFCNEGSAFGFIYLSMLNVHKRLQEKPDAIIQ